MKLTYENVKSVQTYSYQSACTLSPRFPPDRLGLKLPASSRVVTTRPSNLALGPLFPAAASLSTPR